MKRVLVVVLLVVAALVAPAAASAAGQSHLKAVAAGTHGRAASGAVPQRRALDARAEARAKAAANARAGTTQARPGAALVGAMFAPISFRSWNGLADTSGSPSDSTGAIGPTRYIELVNRKFGIYSRTSNVPLSSGTLVGLTGTAGATNNVFDPQIIWDNQTQRFYYASDNIVDSTHNFLMFGWSKTATPASGSSADWCKYALGYGTPFPDFPKLGDSFYFMMLGVNVFANNGSGGYLGSDILAFNKPAAGTTCPSPPTVTRRAGVKDAGGVNPAFTPTPANEIDNLATGYAIARSAGLPASFLTLFRITRSATGTPVIPANGVSVTVPSYGVPADAPTPGFTQRTDTSDTRPTQAVVAIDPNRGRPGFGAVALWMQHTTLGGAGAEVRWYEINPVATVPTLFQSGKVTSTTLYNFNAAISPDRVANGSTRAFGQNMVMTFNTSSSTVITRIQVVSKLGASLQSAPVLIKASTGGNTDFTCPTTSSVCRWGDYSAATPDPLALTTGTAGAVWITNQWNILGNPTGVVWRTWNAAITP
jgi:hypothetical protein